jgi:hypothetical protein
MPTADRRVPIPTADTDRRYRPPIPTADRC